MKILHVIDSGGLYGAEQVILNLCEFSLIENYQTIILSIGNRGEGEKALELEAEKKNISVIKLRFRKGLNFSGAFKIIKKAQELDVDVIHSHGYKSNILLGIMPRFLRKIPVVTTLHGWTSYKKFSKLWFYRILDIFALKNIDRVVSVSEGMNRNTLLKSAGIHPVTINNGLSELEFDINGFTNIFPEIVSECVHCFKILSIGRLSPEKGYDNLIQAVAELKREKIEVCLVIAGDGPELTKLQDLIRELKIEKNVYLVGYYPQFYKFTPFFDVFVLSSYTEGLPITLLEVMQWGIPVVASAVGEIPNVLKNGKYGRLVEPGNAVELVSALSAVNKSKKESTSKTGKTKQYILKNFGLREMTRQYLSEYQKLAEAGHITVNHGS